MKLLELKNIHASVEDKEILKGIDLTINEGELHALLGPNGSGKSTLMHSIMGNPEYEVSGEIVFEGEHIEDLSADKRARKGIFLSFQAPQEIQGITMSEYLRYLAKIKDPDMSVAQFAMNMARNMKNIGLDEKIANRHVNFGFSGGEKKKSELLQMNILDPKLVMLDEIDSGLDIDAIKSVRKIIKEYINDPKKSLLIITHHREILSDIKPDFVHVLKNGKIVKSGDSSLLKYIEQEGFENL